MNQRRLTEQFLKRYNAVETDCAHKFNKTPGALTEYIERLNNARYAPRRDETLPALVRYRNLRNRIVSDPDAFKNEGELDKSDLAWLSDFDRLLQKQKDPLSVYFKKAHSYERRRKSRSTVIFLGIIFLLLCALAVSCFYFFRH